VEEVLIRKTLPYALAQLCLIAFQWAAMIFMPVFFKERGVSDAGVGTLISLFSLSTLALVFPMGVLSDRVPPRPLLLGGALLAVAASMVMPFCRGFYQMASAMALAGAAFTFSSIALYSLFFKQVGGQRGVEVSIFTIGGIMGAGLGAWGCGNLMQLVPVTRALFPVLAGSALAWAVVALFLPRGEGIAFPILEYGQDLKRLRTWVLIAIMFVTASHSGFEQAGYTLLQTEVIGLSTKMVGDLFLIIALWMTVTTLWTGRLHDQEERPLLMMGLALILSGAFMAASGSARGALDFLIYRLLHTAGDSVFQLLTLVVAAMIFPKRRVGGAFAFGLTINTASYFLFANVAGVIGQHSGFRAAFHVSGLIEVIGGIALLMFRSRLRGLFSISPGGEAE
jgi:MFS family permease